MALSACGQSFTLASDAILGYVKFVTYRGGVDNLPVGFLVARLYRGVAFGGGIIPDDDPVNSGILAESNPVDMETLTGWWNTFTFSGSQQYTLEAGVTYVIQVEVLSATVLDATNNVWVQGPNVNCVVGVESYYNTITWLTATTYDVCVQVFDTGDNLLYECPDEGCHSYGHDVLDSRHPSINQANCEAAGRYWYNGACHSSLPSPEQINNQSDCERYNYIWCGFCRGNYKGMYCPLCANSMNRLDENNGCPRHGIIKSTDFVNYGNCDVCGAPRDRFGQCTRVTNHCEVITGTNCN